MSLLKPRRAQAIDANGNPLFDSKLFFGVFGQDPQISPIIVFSDEAETIELAQPISADTEGKFTDAFFSQDFSYVILNPDGTDFEGPLNRRLSSRAVFDTADATTTITLTETSANLYNVDEGYVSLPPAGVYQYIFPTTNTDAVTVTFTGLPGVFDVGDGNGNAIAAGVLLANQPMAIFWTGTEFKLQLVSAPPSFLTYAKITGNTSLVVGTEYDDSSGTNTHTLPLLSTTISGDRIRVFESGTDRAVIIDEDAGDSGAEIATLYAVGNYVEFVSNGTAWVIAEEKVTISIELYLTADDSIPMGAYEKVFDIGYAVDVNIGGWWDAVTNNRLDAGFDAEMLVSGFSANTSGRINFPFINEDGTPIDRGVNVGFNAGSIKDGQLLRVVSGSNYEFFAFNTDVAADNDLNGDAAKDETFLKFELLKRIR